MGDRDVTDSDLRLHCGEMTPAELRACRAGFEYGRLRARVPEGFVLVDRSLVPQPAVDAGVKMLDLSRRLGSSDEVTVLTVFTEMVLLAAAPAPEAAKCARCNASTGAACDDRGCGYLNAGNGAPEAAPSSPAPAVEISPEFTDSARAAIAWVLYHHQGGNSPVGQSLRFALGMGAYETLPEWRVAEAKRWAAAVGATSDEFRTNPAPAAAEAGGVEAVKKSLTTEGDQ